MQTHTKVPVHDITIALVANGAVGSAIEAAFVAAGLPPPRTAEDLHECGASDLTIVALEGAAIGTLLDANRTLLAAGANALFLTCEGEHIVAGPLVVPRVSACFECRLRH